MAYNSFTDSQPTASNTVNEFSDYTRENLMALRDAVIIGAMENWDYAPSGSPLSEPSTVTYSKTDTNEALRGTLTWGTSGGSDGNVTQAVWEYCADDTASPQVWETIGTQSITYNADATVTAVSWA